MRLEMSFEVQTVGVNCNTSGPYKRIKKMCVYCRYWYSKPIVNSFIFTSLPMHNIGFLVKQTQSEKEVFFPSSAWFIVINECREKSCLMIGRPWVSTVNSICWIDSHCKIAFFLLSVWEHSWVSTSTFPPLGNQNCPPHKLSTLKHAANKQLYHSSGK